MLTFLSPYHQLQCYFAGGIVQLGEQQSEVCKGLVYNWYILKVLHCESMLLYPLQDLDMYLSLPFLTRLCDGKFSDLLRACSATDTMYHVLVHSQKSHMRNCLFRFYVTVNYKLFKSSTFLPLYHSLHPYDVFKQLQNTQRTH